MRAAVALAVAIGVIGYLARLPGGNIAFALALFLLVAALAQGALGDAERFGAPNTVTLSRAAGAALLAALALAPPHPSAGWWLLIASSALLALDGVDGWLARRQDLVSDFGARFDMEVDALTGLALAALVFGFGKAGAFVFVLGLMRYAFLALGWAFPAFAAPLPPSLRRKTVCVVQLGLLTLLLAPPVVVPWSTLLALVALGLLAWSFALDILWLARR